MTYNHDVGHPYFCPSRVGFIRSSIKNQGLVGVRTGTNEQSNGKATRLTWLVSLDLGGSIPSAFSNFLMVQLMGWPIAVVHDVEATRLKETTGNPEEAFKKNVPEELTLEDCIVDKKAHQTLAEQRDHFCERMRDMATAGEEEEGEWTFYGKTQMKG